MLKKIFYGIIILIALQFVVRCATKNTDYSEVNATTDNTLETKCEANDAEACFTLSSNAYKIKDYPKANSYANKACDLNNSKGCTSLGSAYSEGKGVRHDYSKAQSYYEKACNLNEGVGCALLGALYSDGKGVRKNSSKAKFYLGKACDLGVQIGCDAYKVLNEMGIR